MDTIFRNHRSKPGEAWQLDRYQLPLWIDPPEGEPYRPWVVMCRSLRTGRMESSHPRLDEPGLEDFREVLTEASRSWRLAPERIEVADAGIAEGLRSLLAADEVPVELRDDLPELRADLEEKTRALRKVALPGALSVPGVTLEQVAGFARAAVAFAQAVPWRYLDLQDVLLLEASGLPPELRYARVIGPSPNPGLLFHPEIREDAAAEDEGDFDEGDFDAGDFDAGDFDEGWDADEAGEADEDAPASGLEDVFGRERLWMVVLGSRVQMSPDDVELWEQHQLPVAHGRAFPLAARMRPDGFERPGPDLLPWIEAALAALGATAEAEIDTGRWTKEVRTSAGPVRLVLSLPDLLEDAEAEQSLALGEVSYRAERAMFELRRALERGDQEGAQRARALLDSPEEDSLLEAWTEEDRAGALAYEAREAVGRRQILLARRALGIWPDCADAWVVLASRATNPEAARDLFSQGVAAGERALAAISKRQGTPPEELFEARAYLQARAGLAAGLWDLGVRDEAIEHYRGMLAFDPADESGIRYLLAHALLSLDRNDEVEELLTRYWDNLPDWHYTRALLTFRQEGDSPAARQQLARGLETDLQIAEDLLAEVPSRKRGGHEDEEEVGYEELFRDVWEATPGALDWLQACMPDGEAPHPSGVT